MNVNTEKRRGRPPLPTPAAWAGLSRQRRYQLRRQAEGRCILCAAPLEDDKVTCAVCRAKANHRYAKKAARKRREAAMLAKFKK